MDEPEYVKITIIVEDGTDTKKTIFRKATPPTIMVDYDVRKKPAYEISIDFGILPDDKDQLYITADSALGATPETIRDLS